MPGSFINGIWNYAADGSDAYATTAEMLNALADSASDTVGDINADIAALEAQVVPASWQNVTITASGWSTHGTFPLQLRRVGSRVEWRGGVNVTAWTGSEAIVTSPSGLGAFAARSGRGAGIAFSPTLGAIVVDLHASDDGLRLKAVTTGASAAQTVYFDGVSYEATP
jgi:hypothetical protein